MGGMSERSGIGRMSNRPGVLNCSLLGTINVPYRKPVRPETNTFKTTPTMSWLTRNLMLNTARTMDTAAPAAAAAIRPMYGLPPVMVATRAAVNAPPRSCPSMAMFTTPTRSHSTPESEPKTSGTASVTEPATRPASEMEAGGRLPRSKQARRTRTPLQTRWAATWATALLGSRGRSSRQPWPAAGCRGQFRPPAWNHQGRDRNGVAGVADLHLGCLVRAKEAEEDQGYERQDAERKRNLHGRPERWQGR